MFNIFSNLFHQQYSKHLNSFHFSKFRSACNVLISRIIMIVAVLNAVKNEQQPGEERSVSEVTGGASAFFISFTNSFRLVSPSLVRSSLIPPRPCANLRCATIRHMYIMLSHHYLCIFYIIFYKENKSNSSNHQGFKNHLCKMLIIKFKTFY